MFTHIVVGADDLAAAKDFYDAALGALGVGPGVEMGERIVNSTQAGILLVTKPIDGDPATFGNGITIGLSAPNVPAVDAPSTKKASPPAATRAPLGRGLRYRRWPTSQAVLLGREPDEGSGGPSAIALILELPRDNFCVIACKHSERPLLAEAPSNREQARVSGGRRFEERGKQAQALARGQGL
jgi:catechol 2,3-dioxygenase-like lactoylglutathione lyase family enzyme